MFRYLKSKLTLVNALFIAFWLLITGFIIQTFFYAHPRWAQDTVVINYLLDTNNGLYFNLGDDQANNKVFLSGSNTYTGISRALLGSDLPWYQRFVKSDVKGNSVYLANSAPFEPNYNYIGADLLFDKNKVCMDLNQQVMVLTDQNCPRSDTQLTPFLTLDIKPSKFTNLWALDVTWPNQPSIEAVIGFSKDGLSSSADCKYTRAMARANKKGQLSISGAPVQLTKSLLGRHVGKECNTLVGIKFFEQQKAKFMELDFLEKTLVLFR